MFTLFFVYSLCKKLLPLFVSSPNDLFNVYSLNRNVLCQKFKLTKVYYLFLLIGKEQVCAKRAHKSNWENDISWKSKIQLEKMLCGENFCRKLLSDTRLMKRMLRRMLYLFTSIRCWLRYGLLLTHVRTALCLSFFLSALEPTQVILCTIWSYCMVVAKKEKFVDETRT